MLTKNFHQLQAEVQRHVAADHVAQGSYETCFIGCLAEGKDSPGFIESEYGIPLAVSRIAETIFEGLPSDEAALFLAALPSAVESDGKDLSRVVWQFLAAELRSFPPVTPEVQAVIDPVIKGMDLLAEGKEWLEEDAKAAEWAARAAAWTSGANGASFYVAAANAAASAAASAASAAAWKAIDAAYCAASAAYSAASAAAWKAIDAAYCAARAAEWAARAAASAAVVDDYLATFHRQRDLLLKLIKKAPITQQENN